MKTKHALIILALGYCLEFVAALYKILHWNNADLLFIVSTVVKVLGALLFVYKLITHPRLKVFFNS